MDKNLEKLKENNSSIEIVEKNNHINISQMWEDNSFMCRFDVKTDFVLFGDAKFPKELSAIFHEKGNGNSELEFIFNVLKENDSIIKRNFTFYYNGKKFHASFKEPTELFKLIAKGFEKIAESDTEYRNIYVFNDFYNIENLPKYIQLYFKNRIPINFFVKGNFSEIDNFISFSKHLNFYMHYYDRKTPCIVIHEKEEKAEYELPCNFVKNRVFPNEMNFRDINPVLMDLFHIAKNTDNIRQKFIFYYQVLEYCAYYYLNDDLKRNLTNVIKTPDLLNNPSKYASLLIENFKDHFRPNDDSQKLEKLLKDYCSWEYVKNEIECNKEYFSKDFEFDGGFKIKGLIDEKDNLDTEPKGIVKKIKDNIEKIRNVLVHIRESRENKVILPTAKNNGLLIPYLYIIQRIAENIAIRYE